MEINFKKTLKKIQINDELVIRNNHIKQNISTTKLP